MLGDDVEIRITVWDETNTRIRPDEIIAQIRESGGRGTGRAGRRADQPVSARRGHRPSAARRGHPGVHRRLPRQRLHRDAAGRPCRTFSEAMDLGITLFAGEAEGRLDDLLRAAYRNELSRSTTS